MRTIMDERQNVVLIVLDTARYDAVSPETTPTIFEIASEGINFENAFSCAPWTLPSHASLFTGTYPSRHKSSAQYRELDQDFVTMAEIFQTNDYHTKGFSNNVWINKSLGFAKGFDEFHHGWQYIESDNDIAEAAVHSEGWDKAKGVLRRMGKGNMLKNSANLLYALRQKFLSTSDDGAKRTTDQISTWINDRTSKKPFFLFVNYLEPHLEYRPPEKFSSEFLPENVSYDEAMEVPQNAWKYITNQTDISDSEFEILRCLYDAELRYLDRQISKLIESLKEGGEWENTTLIITGDHGENIGHHDLMDHQYCLYDSLIHVPLIVHGNGITIDDESVLVQLNDLLPTLVDGLNLETGDIGDQIQGVSLYNEVEDRREYVFAEYRYPQPSKKAIQKRVGDPHNVMSTYDRSLTAVRDKDWKLIVGSDGLREVYKIGEDPGEQENIYSQSEHAFLEEIISEWQDQFSFDEKEESRGMSEETKHRLEDLGYLQ